MLAFSTAAEAADCDDAKAYADDAYTYARRAYNATTLSELHRNAKKAMDAASSAESEASSCGCSDAESSASDAYSYARKALREDDFDEAQSYARKARNAADELVSQLNDCDDKKFVGPTYHAFSRERPPRAEAEAARRLPRLKIHRQERSAAAVTPCGRTRTRRFSAGPTNGRSSAATPDCVKTQLTVL
jgi:hypothetical protein